MPRSSDPKIAGLRRADRPRLCVAAVLGHDVDGAWWPRTDKMTRELPHLVAAMRPLLGDVTAINVNWPALQRPPDLNWGGWEHRQQHLITLHGPDRHANLLIVPYETNNALATMVLRRAADLPISAVDRTKRAYVVAGAILLAAQRQSAPEGRD